MTHLGHIFLGAYCLINVLILTVSTLRNMEKGKKEGWELIALVPLLIFLVNVI